MKNETRRKVREKMLESCLLKKAGLVDTAADKIEEVVDVLSLIHISRNILYGDIPRFTQLGFRIFQMCIRDRF